MTFWIGRIYEAITGIAAPSVPAVRRAIGAAAPCEQTLRRWRKGLALPSEADVFLLLSWADKVVPTFSRENEAAIRDAWWTAARAKWAEERRCNHVTI